MNSILPHGWELDREEDAMEMMTEVPGQPKPKIHSLTQTYGHAVPAHLQHEATVTMLFPNKVGLQLDDHAGFIQFQAGIQEVPASLADHPHLKKSGVKVYDKTPPANVETEAEMIARLQARGYQIKPIEAIPTHTVPQGGPDKGEVAVSPSAADLDGVEEEEEARKATASSKGGGANRKSASSR